MLLVDTQQVAAPDRVAAVNAALTAGCVASRIVHKDPAGDVHATMHLWTIGPCKLVTAHATGLRQTRTPKHLRGDDQPEMLALAMQSRGLAQYDKSGHQQVVRTGDLMINDLTSPYDVNWPDDGGSSAFNVTYDLLGVPVDLARRAAPLLHTSPLYSLVQHHLGTLIRQAPVLSEDPGAPALAAATVELLRALLVSAAADDRLARPVRADTQLTRIMAYARQHLTDPGLTPARLAAVHGLSERSLYLLLRDAGISLEQWIITQRLEGARRDLAAEGKRHRTIAAIARTWGFTDPSYFTRRFQRAYGALPKDFRQAARSPD
ncbi:helix-turn-helix domain-containing protein [Streptomyces sp. NPDC054950]|uniref:helix-turn-helix domain-containing protein n=1 Tax=Streptomyces sp. NBC_00723 TaxID=2903673 RepID=UPI0006BB1982|nr:transcriptional regulator with only HTH domain, AraC family [Actinobacteria bacterium OV320]